MELGDGKTIGVRCKWYNRQV